MRILVLIHDLEDRIGREKPSGRSVMNPRTQNV